MNSRTASTLTTLAATLGAALIIGIPGTAEAGIIVTVGRPSPELSTQDAKKQPSGFDGQRKEQQYVQEGTRCVTLPDGQVACAKSIRVENASSVPKDWRCVTVDAKTLFCELPAIGAGPSAAGYGELNLSSDETEVIDVGADAMGEEVEALGCAGGPAGSALPLAGAVFGLLLLGLRTRRA